VAVLACLSAFGQGYRGALGAELDRMGVQLMLVPLGCPFDAAARVLKARTLENSLPAAALAETRRDSAVAVAAPLLIVSVPRPAEGRTDMWVGLDETALSLKPWWQVRAGARWFAGTESVILGSDAAELEMRAPGDAFYSPETGRALRVAGVLARSGTSDDSLFFVPLATAQSMFRQPGRLTAIAIRLRDPSLLREASQRLQRIPGAQIVTLTEMMGTFQNLLGAVRALLLAIAVVAVVVSLLSVFNTLLAGVVERTGELALLRALGASRAQTFGLIALEAVLLAGVGSIAGLLLAAFLAPGFEHVARGFVPLAPAGSLLSFTAATALPCLAAGLGVGLLAAIYPAWQASRMQPAQALHSETP
jgi:putative ABC transport system permease protein